MRTTVHGHVVTTQPCDGLRNHWRIRADGVLVGLVAQGRDDWRTLPVLPSTAPVCHAPTLADAIATLVAEIEMLTARRLFS